MLTQLLQHITTHYNFFFLKKKLNKFRQAHTQVYTTLQNFTKTFSKLHNTLQLYTFFLHKKQLYNTSQHQHLTTLLQHTTTLETLTALFIWPNSTTLFKTLHIFLLSKLFFKFYTTFNNSTKLYKTLQFFYKTFSKISKFSKLYNLT